MGKPRLSVGFGASLPDYPIPRDSQDSFLYFIKQQGICIAAFPGDWVFSIQKLAIGGKPASIKLNGWTSSVEVLL
jgi:hypothetical protein